MADEQDDKVDQPDPADEPPRENNPLDEMAAAMGEAPEPTNEPQPIKLLRQIDKVLGVLELAAVGLFLTALVGVAAYKGISAKFLGEDPAWTKEFIWHMLFLTGMAAAALSVQTRQIIKMDFVTRMVAPRTRTILQIATYLFAVAVLSFVIMHGWDARAGYQDAPDLLDDHLIATSLPITMSLICTHLILHAAIDAIYLMRGETPPEPDQPAVH